MDATSGSSPTAACDAKRSRSVPSSAIRCRSSTASRAARRSRPATRRGCTTACPCGRPLRRRTHDGRGRSKNAMAYAPFDLSGSVALVTGGNSGIGLGMAEALAAAGAAVCIWGTDETKNAAAATTLATHGGRVLALRCDVGDEAQVDAALAHTVDELGRVDACFANAGVAGGGPSFVDMTADEWRRVLRVNLDGAFFTLRAAARHMVARGSGGSLLVAGRPPAVRGAARDGPYPGTEGALS